MNTFFHRGAAAYLTLFRNPRFLFASLIAGGHLAVNTGRRYDRGESCVPFDAFSDFYRSVNLFLCAFKGNAYGTFCTVKPAAAENTGLPSAGNNFHCFNFCKL